MSLRRRMVLLTAAAVAFAVVLSAAAGYVAVDHSLRSRVDRQLKELAGDVKGVASTLAVVRGASQAGGASEGGACGARQSRTGTRGDAAVFTARAEIYKSPGDQTRFALLPSDLAVAPGRPRHISAIHILPAAQCVYIARLDRAGG